MTQALRLVRHGFISLENHNPHTMEELGIFVDDATETAYVKLERFLAQMEPVQPYLGWDKKVYPRFEVEAVNII